MSIPRNLSKLAEGTDSSGILGIAYGGTGGSSQADAKAALGLHAVATSGSYSDLLNKPTTANIIENTNLYFTDARSRASVSASGSLSYNSATGVFSYTTPSTSGISEGTNLYYTDARARGALSASTGISYNSTTGAISTTITQYTDTLARGAVSASGDLSYNSTTGVFSYTTPSTSGIAEGTNLYFTDARARASISVTGAGSYNSTTGVINIVGGVTSFNTRTGAITLSSADVTGALGFTPYNATNPSGYLTGITSSQVTTALGFTPYNATNPNGYITGITSSNVTTALGFTPYNATNPSGYISGITSGMVTTALGYTPYNSSNPSGYITSAALSPYLPLAGGTITGPIYSPQYDNSSRIMFNSASTYYLGLTGNVSTSGGSLSMVQYNSESGALANVVNSYALLHSGNYNSYSPTLTGGNASGTWGISITGNAATVTNGLYKVGTNAIPAAVVLNTTADNWMWQWASSGINDWYLGPTTANFGIGGSRLAISSSGSSAAAELSIERGTTRLLEILQANLQYKGNVVLHAGNYGSYALPLTGGTVSGLTTFTHTTGGADPLSAVHIVGGGTHTGLYINPAASSQAHIRFGTAGTLKWQVRVPFQDGADSDLKYYSWVAANDIYTFSHAGNATASSSWRAPIFYDTNDTSYYSDPNATSSLRAVNYWGLQQWAGNDVYAIGTPTYGFRFNNNANTINAFIIENSGTTVSYASSRAPIFYDSNNTGYYLDPASTSNIRKTNIVASGSGWDDCLNLYSSDASNRWNLLVDQGASNWLRFAYNQSEKFYIRPDGAVIATTDLRAPIFYDSSDTNYYVDPNGNSVLTTATFNLNASSILRLTTAGTNASMIKAGSGDELYVGGNDTWQMRFSGANVLMDNGGYLLNGESIRSPIFYDSDDTSYYTSPNGNSRLYSLGLGGATPDTRLSIAGDSHFVGILHLGGTAGSVGSWGSRDYTTSGNRYFNANSYNFDNYGYGSNWTFTLSGGNAEASSSLRAPIFYDNNNTGYYVDPAGTSRMSNINYDNLYFSGDTTYGLIGRNGYLDTVNGRGSDPLELNYYDGGTVIIGSGASKSLLANGLYANIFYEKDSTGYYTDPGSTSNLNSLEIRGTLRLFSSEALQIASPNLARQRADSRDESSDSRTHWYGLTTSGGTSNFRHAWYDGSAYFNVTASGGEVSFNRVGGGGYVSSNESLRTPIFYDLNDTGYYVNPNGVSYLHQLTLAGGGYFRPNNWIQMDGNYGIYWPNSSGTPHWHPNDSTYGPMQLSGIKNSYSGIRLPSSNNVTIGMFDSGGNGGLYNYSYWIYYWLVGNACLGVRTSSTSSAYAMYVDGGIYSTGNVVAYSDARKKKEIVTVDNALATVNKLRGVFYKRIETNDEKVDPNKRQIGVIAQEVNEVLPEAVTYAKDVDEYGVQYGNMAGLFIEAIKELTSTVEKLNSKIQELEKKVNS